MKRIAPIFIAVIMIFIANTTVYADNEESDTKIAPFKSGYIPDDKSIELKLQPGFDFINQSSETLNWELALTGAVLSEEVYDFSELNPNIKDVYDYEKKDQGEEARSTIQPVLISLGYDETRYCYYPDNLQASFQHPTCCFGYKRYKDNEGKDKNIFIIVVRGTHGGNDITTDVIDGGTMAFIGATKNVENDFIEFVDKVVGKEGESIKNEDNFFFITGHSLGGAIANRLSIANSIVDLAHNDKSKIYTYTYESPHTCQSYWWMYEPKEMSNAFNIKDIDDFVVNIPPGVGATRYGTDLEYSVNDLDNQIFMSLFPTAEGGSVTEAPKRHYFGWDHFFGGHHDMGLPLTYILQKGIQAKAWESVEDVVETNTPEDTTNDYSEFMAGYLAAMRYPEGKVDKMELIDSESWLFASQNYWSISAGGQYGTSYEGAEIIDCGNYYEVKNCLIKYPYFIQHEIYDLFETGFEFDLTLEDQNGQKDTIHNVVSYMDGNWVLSDNVDPPEEEAWYVQVEEDGIIDMRFFMTGEARRGIIYRGSLFFTKDCIVHDALFKGTETFEEYVSKVPSLPNEGDPWFQGGKYDNSSILFTGKVIFDPDTGMITECQELYHP